MLPLGVLVQKMLSDSAARNRVLGAMLAMVLLVGAFATGLSINIQLGDTGGDQPLAVTSTVDPETGEEVLVDQDGNVVDEQAAADAGLTATTAASRSTSGGEASSGGRQAADSGAGGGVSQSQAAAGSDEAAPAPTPSATAQNADRCAGADLQATDQGVGEETIKFGFLISDLGPLAQAGFEVGEEGDYQPMLEAWANELNRNGGVACREVTFVTEKFDVLSVDDMNEKCKIMTEDHKVFTVFTSGGYDSVAQLCIAKDHQTPFLNPEAEPAHWYREAAPYLWNTLMSKDRTHRNHVKLLLEHGELHTSATDGGAVDPADQGGDLDSRQKKIGVIYHGIPNVGPSVENALLPELEANGIDVARVKKLSADSERAISEINQAVLEFNAADIEYVFMPMNLIFKTQFMQQAEQQNYFPEYTDSDHYYGCFDFVTETYPERSWDKTKCVTASDVASRPDLEEYTNNHPYAQYADQVYLRTNPDGYDKDGERTEAEAEAQRGLHHSVGTLILLWSEAANRVGPELTRAKWGVEMGRTGKFHKCLCEHPLTFGPEKWTGPDYVKMLQWHAEAGDGYEARTYHELTRPRPAFF